MPTWRGLVGTAVALTMLVAACAPPPENASIFLSGTPLNRVETPTISRPKAPAASTPVLGPTPRAAIARGGSGVGHPQDSTGLPILVYLDPGHGGVDVGTSGTDVNDQSVVEKVVTLAIARQTATYLRADRIGVALSREDDSLVGLQPSDYTSDGNLLTPAGVLHDLQGRVDRANASGALVFVSIHLNAFSDPSVGGSETFFDSGRGFADQNRALAQLVQTHVVDTLHGRNVVVIDRGITDDQTLSAESLGALGVPYNHLIVLGPAVAGRLRATQMPGALSEPLFLSNPTEATAAGQQDVQSLLARAYADAIEEYLRS